MLAELKDRRSSSRVIPTGMAASLFFRPAPAGRAATEWRNRSVFGTAFQKGNDVWTGRRERVR